MTMNVGLLGRTLKCVRIRLRSLRIEGKKRCHLRALELTLDTWGLEQVHWSIALLVELVSVQGRIAAYHD